jgi:hypothetical protein
LPAVDPLYSDKKEREEEGLSSCFLYSSSCRAARLAKWNSFSDSNEAPPFGYRLVVPFLPLVCRLLLQPGRAEEMTQNLCVLIWI